jgi:integrase
MYRRLLKNHILPALGHLPLSRLTPQHVQAFYADKLKAGLSPRTVQIMHALLHKALENAVRWRLVPRNICEDVSSPRATRYEMQSLTMDQAQRLMEAARGHRFEVLLLLALVTGMRRGELLSLRWKDIQLEEKCLHVRHTVARIAGHGYVENEPKTAQSRRKITLPDFVVEALRQHRTRQLEARLKAGTAWEDHDLVFCNTHGGFLNTDYLRRRFLRLLKDAGLPQMRFHDLRHSAATILLSMRVPPNVVKEILGHSDIGITLGIYGHVLPGMHEEAMDKWSDLFHEQR